MQSRQLGGVGQRGEVLGWDDLSVCVRLICRHWSAALGTGCGRHSASLFVPAGCSLRGCFLDPKGHWTLSQPADQSGGRQTRA